MGLDRWERERRVKVWSWLWSWRRRHSETAMIAGLARVSYVHLGERYKRISTVRERGRRSIRKTHRRIISLKAKSAAFTIRWRLWSPQSGRSLQVGGGKTVGLNWVLSLFRVAVRETWRAIKPRAAQGTNVAGNIRTCCRP